MGFVALGASGLKSDILIALILSDFCRIIQESVKSSNHPVGFEIMNRHRSPQEYVLSFPSADHDCGAIIIDMISVDDLIPQ
jgi:hypothetical protein